MRRKIATIHKWFGLALSLWVGLQVLSGMALVFREEIKAATFPQVSYGVGTVKLESVLTAVEKSGNAQLLSRVEFPPSHSLPYIVRFKSNDGWERFYSYSDNARLKPLTRSARVYYWLFSFHDHLLLKSSGRYFIGILGVAIVAFSLTGVYLWWPARKKRAFTVNWRGPPAMRYFDLHRVSGILLAPILVVLSLTALMVVWRAFFLTLFPAANIGSVSLTSQLAQCEVAAAAQSFSGEGILSCIETAVGPENIKDIRFDPKSGKATVLIYATDVIRPGALNKLSVDLERSTSVSYTLASKQGEWLTFLDWMYPIHTGDFLGRLSLVVMTIIGAGFAGLVCFSVLLWVSRQRRTGKSAIRKS